MISARPPESRSSVANCWWTRTGSSELITLTALVRRIRCVRSAAAASTTAGADTTKSGLAHPGALIGPAASRQQGELTEGVEPDLHGASRSGQSTVT